MNDTKKITIREAHIGDLDRIVDLHQTCFTAKDHLGMHLGLSFIGAAYAWFIHSPDAITCIADHDGKVIGLMPACKGPYHRLMFTCNKKATAKAFLSRPWIVLYPDVLKRLAGTFRKGNPLVTKLTSDKRYTNFAFLAVHPDHRRQRLAHDMLSALVGMCKKREWYEYYGSSYRHNKAMWYTLSRGGWKEHPMGNQKIIWTMDQTPKGGGSRP